MLTLKGLKKREAYEEAVEKFKEIFFGKGKKAELKQIVDGLHESSHKDWEVWLLSQNLKLTKALVKNGADIIFMLLTIVPYAGLREMAIRKWSS